MKQFFTIFKFEFLTIARNKVFVSISIVLILVVGIVLSFPRITGFFDKGIKTATDTKLTTIALQDISGADENATMQLFSSIMPKNKFKIVDKSEEDLKADVDLEKYVGAIIIVAPEKYKYIVKNISMYDTTSMTINEVMIAKYRLETMQKLGLSVADSQKLLNVNIKSEVIQTGKNQMESFFYTYVLIFALYMAILLYGQIVAMSVASEKSSRAMELLITAAKPVNLMFGKVIGSGVAGLCQMVAILGSGFVFFNLNSRFWVDNKIINSVFNMPLSILLFTILFFVLGYFIYSFMYGALGSLASRAEDVNTSIMPVTFLFIIAFFVVMFSMGSGNVDNPLMIVCSYIPFTSPMAMFVRIAMGNVKPFEIIISVIILIVSTIFVGYISAAIYRIGVLLYGKSPKPTEIIKMLKNSK